MKFAAGAEYPNGQGKIEKRAWALALANRQQPGLGAAVTASPDLCGSLDERLSGESVH